VQDEGVPPLKIAPRVTRKHGETFANEWFRTAGGEDVWAAFAETYHHSAGFLTHKG
jgi:hypothetical protein